MPFYTAVEFSPCPRWMSEIAEWKRSKTKWLPEIISHLPAQRGRNGAIPIAWIKDPAHVLSRCIVLLKSRLFFCPFSVNLFWREFSLPAPLLSPHLLWSPSLEGMDSPSCLQHSVSPSFPSSSSRWLAHTQCTSLPHLPIALHWLPVKHLAAQLGRIVLCSSWARGQGGRESAERPVKPQPAACCAEVAEGAGKEYVTFFFYFFFFSAVLLTSLSA